MGTELERRESAESGIALVITVLLLLLVSAIGITALNRAGDERVVSSASRRQLSNLSAAEAGLRIIRDTLQAAVDAKLPLPQFKLDPADPNSLQYKNFVKDPSSGQYTSVSSAELGKPALPITSLDPNPKTKLGSEMNLGNNSASAGELVYRVNVTATDPSGASTQIQAQFSVPTQKGLAY